MRTFASVGTVKESYLLQLPLKDSCIVHVRLPIGRHPPDGLTMWLGQPMPGQEPIHIGRSGSTGAQSGRRIG